ncbi:MAG: GFA family protein [Proteobacteria bacterium]|nr:GFA family protein [Pseudomonadota bacterium]
MSELPTTGSCVCGAVSFAISPPYLAFQYCHCSRCRKATGSAHAANLFVRPEQFSWTSGEEHARRLELEGAKYWGNGWCDRCGSQLPWLSRSGKSWLVPAGTLDGDPGRRPDRNIYWDSRADWYVSETGLAHHATLPPRS